jgi:ParB-like chromosome segregation protein Spo0J
MTLSRGEGGERIKVPVIINDEYTNLVPRLSTQEYESLKQSIKENGLCVPIIINQHGVLLDGHHRHRACLELGIKDQSVITRALDSPLLEKKFIIEINRNRRHLTTFQRIELQYKIETIENEIAKAKKRMSDAGKVGAEKRWTMKRNQEDTSIDDRIVQNYTTALGRTEELENTGTAVSRSDQFQNEKEQEQQKAVLKGRVIDASAKMAHVSPMTYFKGREIIKNAPEETKQQLRKGNVKIDKVYKQLQKQQKKQELINAKPLLDLPEGNVRLLQGDFVEKSKDFIADNSIDLIFTDPPYGKEQIQLYNSLAIVASRVLKDGGSLVTYAGHHAVPEIIQIMKNSDLTYWWPIAIKLSGPFARFYPRNISIKWKPLLWFVKGNKTNAVDFISDYIESKSPEKCLHEWEQSTFEAEHVISKLTVENQIIFDPMMGSGSTGIAALRLRRKFLGIEIDQETFEIATTRIGKVIDGGLKDPDILSFQQPKTVKVDRAGEDEIS